MRIPAILDLEREAKRCGNCRFCERIELIYNNADVEKLKIAARNILETNPEKPTVTNDDIITLLAIHGKIAAKKIYCTKERTWIGLLEFACAFWQPQTRTKPKTKPPSAKTVPKALCPMCRSVKLKACRRLQVQRWHCRRCGTYFYREQNEPYRTLVNALQRRTKSLIV